MIFKILSSLLAAAVLTLVPSVAFAEAMTLAAFIAHFGTGTMATVIGTTAFIAANLAIAYVAGKILGPKAENARDKDRKQTVQSGIEPRRIVYGEAYNSGPMVYLNTTGSTNEYLHMIVAVATHPSEQITQLLLNDEEFDLTTSSTPIPGAYTGTGTDIANYYVWLGPNEPAEKTRRFNNKVVCVPVTGRWMYGDAGDVERRSLIPTFMQEGSGANSGGIDSLSADRFKVVVTANWRDEDENYNIFPFSDEQEILKVYADSSEVKGLLTNARHYFSSGYYYSGIPAGGTFKVWVGDNEVTGVGPVYGVNADGSEVGVSSSITISGVTLEIGTNGNYTVSANYDYENFDPQIPVVFYLRAHYNSQVVWKTYTLLKEFAYTDFDTGDHYRGIALTATSTQVFAYKSPGGSPLGPTNISFSAAVDNLPALRPDHIEWEVYAWEEVLINANDQIYEWQWVLKPGVLDNITNNFSMEEGGMVADSGDQGGASLGQKLPWNAQDYRLDRCTYVYVRIKHDNEAFSGNIPNIAVKMKGKRLYNPLQDRKFIDNVNYVGATGKPFRDRGPYNSNTAYVVGDLIESKWLVCIRAHTGKGINDRDYWLPTFLNYSEDYQQYLWSYSNNWALTALDYLLDPFYGLNLDTSSLYNELDWTTALNAIKDSYDGGYLDRPSNTIPASRFTTEAAISLLFPKLTTDGVLDTATTPIQNLETLFTGGGGELAYSQGQHSIYAGVYREAEGNPEVDYSIVVDESYLAGEGISLDTAIPNSDLFNIIQGVYVDNLNRGELTEFSPIYGEAYVEEDGQEYIIDVDYPMTTNYNKAELLGIQTLEEGRLNEIISLTCNFKIFKYKVGDIVFVKNDLLGYNENVFPSQLNAVDSYKQFKIVSMDIKENFEVEVVLQEISYKPYNPDFVWNIPPERELPRYPAGDIIMGVLRPTDLVLSPVYIKEVAAGISYHFTDVSWYGPLAVNANEIGFDLIDSYQIRYTPVGEAVFDQFLQETTTTEVVLRGYFSAGKVDLVEILNPVGHYGYWTDGEITINTGFIGSNANERAVVKYRALGNGKMEISEILSQGTNYSAGIYRLSGQDTPKPLVATPAFSSDNVHAWRQTDVAANNLRKEHALQLLLEDGTEDYAIGVRARAGDRFSNWTHTYVRGGQEIPDLGVKIIRVTSDFLGFTFDELGSVTSPASGFITYTATSGTINLQDIVFEVEASDGGATLTDNLDGTATMSLAQFGTSNWARVRARHVTLPNVYDVVVTYKLQGRDGQSAVYGSVEADGPLTYVFADGSWSNTDNRALTAVYYEGDSLPITRQFTVNFSNGVLSCIPAPDINGVVEPDENGISLVVYGNNTNVFTAVFSYKDIKIAATVQALRDGDAGYSTVVLQAYKRSAIVPIDNPGQVIYNFSTGAWNPDPPANGWSRFIPEGFNQLYIISSILTANTPTATATAESWNEPRGIMERGPRGYNTAIVNAYKRSMTFPLDNPGNVQYSFLDRTWTPSPSSGWTTTIPEGTDQLYVTSATAFAEGDIDNIITAEWSTPVGILSDGHNAATVFIYKRSNTAGTPPLHTGDSTYTFDPPSLTPLNNDWFNFIPETGGDFLWVRTATAVSQSNEDIILNAEWSNVSLLTRPGADAQYVIVNGQQVFKYLAGASIPENPTIVLSAALFGGLTTYSWEYWTGAAWTPLSGTNNISSYSLAYNNAAWNGETSLRIRCLSNNDKYDEITIAKLFDAVGGETTFVSLLSNQTHLVPSNFDGTGKVLTSSGTLISAYAGATQLEFVTGTGFPGINGQFTVERIAYTGGVTSTSAITKDVLNAVVPDITAMTDEVGSILFVIKIRTDVGANVTLYATQTFALAKGGIDGSPPRYVVVNGQQVFKFLPGEIIPVDTNITLSAELFGGLTTYSWEYWTGAAWTPLTPTGTSATYSLAYNNAAWADLNILRIRCVSNDNIYDEISIVKVRDAEGGESSFAVLLDNETHTIPANTDGSKIYTNSGTLISAFEGTNRLQFEAGAGFPTLNGRFRVERTAFTGGVASAGDILAGGEETKDAVVPNITNITGPTGSIKFTINIRNASGNTVAITKLQTFSFTGSSKYIIVNGEQAFKYIGGNTVPTNSPLALSAQLFGGLTTYLWQYWHIGNMQWTPLSPAGTSATYSLAYNNSAWGANQTSLRIRCVSDTYFDEITILKLTDGANAFTALLNNGTHAITVNKDGIPTSTAGSGTRIKVYEGTSTLQYVTGTGTPPNPGTYRVTFTTENVTAVNGSGSIPQSGTDALTGGINAFAPPNNTGAINFTINIRSTTNTIVSLPQQQTFSKTYPGEDGKDVLDVRLSNPNHQVPTTNTGVVLSLANTGTRISVFEGETQLQYITGTSTPATNGRFTVTFTAVGVASNSTSGQIVGNVLDAVTANLSSFGATHEGALIFTIRARTTSGSIVQLQTQQSFVKVRQGDTGPPGSSVVQLIVYRRSATALGTPTGGSFNFGTKVLTPPSGWAITVPSGTTNVYFSRASASVSGTTGTDSNLTWSVPALAEGIFTPITSEDLAAGLDIPMVHGGTEPAGVFLGSNLVYWTGGGVAARRMYRWTGSAYVNTASANDIVAGTITSAITAANTFLLSSNGKIYTQGKTSAFSSTKGVFLGHDGGSNYDFAVGDGTKFIRYDGSANTLTLGGTLVTTGNIPLNNITTTTISNTSYKNIAKLTPFQLMGEPGGTFDYNAAMVNNEPHDTIFFTVPARAGSNLRTLVDVSYYLVSSHSGYSNTSTGMLEYLNAVASYQATDYEDGGQVPRHEDIPRYPARFYIAVDFRDPVGTISGTNQWIRYWGIAGVTNTFSCITYVTNNTAFSVTYSCRVYLASSGRGTSNGLPNRAFTKTRITVLAR